MLCPWSAAGALTAQTASTELSGEYILPPGFELPRSITQVQQAPVAAAAAGSATLDHRQQQQQPHRTPSSLQDHHRLHQQQQQQQQQVTADLGRWRLQLVVPQAAVEELLPAGQLLRQAGRRSARNYSLAKQSLPERAGHSSHQRGAGVQQGQVREGGPPWILSSYAVLYGSICQLTFCKVCMWGVVQMTTGSHWLEEHSREGLPVCQFHTSQRQSMRASTGIA